MQPVLRVWRPDLPDGGLTALEAGLEGAGYTLADVAMNDNIMV
jgi:hypothetical protein